ncbi:DNA cross-link repair protein [Thraustotheca clavata]|uniref:DNA cross-link repair protein n=1 Tax=Thraustotheca clavata TaxID=74557 RepID=A0A1W0A0T8_9STRA|nr:DNA cross-link repair protein [Thraustotheca clavata]
MSRRRLLSLRSIPEEERPMQKPRKEEFKKVSEKVEVVLLDSESDSSTKITQEIKINKIAELATINIREDKSNDVALNETKDARDDSKTNTLLLAESTAFFDGEMGMNEDDNCLLIQKLEEDNVLSEKEMEKTCENEKSKVLCPSCGKNLTFYHQEAQLNHINACLDAIHEFERNKRDAEFQAVIAESIASFNVVQPAEEDTCKICGLSFAEKSPLQRIQHTKQCAKKYGVSLQTLLQVDPLVSELNLNSMNDADANAPPNAFEVLMRRKSRSQQQEPATEANANAFDIMMRGAQSSAVVSKKPATKPSASFKRKPFEKRNNKYSCPDYKKIKGTDIIVDGFQYASPTLSNTYVLSHFHSDHYTGLNKSFGAGIVYCTPITARLVSLCLGVNEKYLHPLPLNQPYRLPNHNVQMTFLDANHCPGAALILFQFTSGKNILHTGDFRFDPTILQNRFLAPLTSPSTDRLDIVYLDTTYCSPEHCHPTQTIAINEAKRLVDLHSNDRALFLVGSYSIGKERLFMDVAKHLNCKVFVERAKLSLLSCFEWSKQENSRLTTESSITNLHVVPMNHLNFDGMRALLTKHRLRFKKVIALQPTGWTFSKKKGPTISSKRTQMNDSLIIYGIPYRSTCPLSLIKAYHAPCSEHSSFNELCAFIKAFEPKTIIPTVNCTKSTQQHNPLIDKPFILHEILINNQDDEVVILDCLYSIVGKHDHIFIGCSKMDAPMTTLDFSLIMTETYSMLQSQSPRAKQGWKQWYFGDKSTKPKRYCGNRLGRCPFICLHVFLGIVLILLIVIPIITAVVIPKSIQNKFASALETSSTSNSSTTSFIVTNNELNEFTIQTKVASTTFLPGTSLIIVEYLFILNILGTATIEGPFTLEFFDSQEKYWGNITVNKSIEIPINKDSIVSIPATLHVFDTPSASVLSSFLTSKELRTIVKTTWIIKLWGFTWYHDLALRGVYIVRLNQTIQDKFSSILTSSVTASSSKTSFAFVKHGNDNFQLNTTIPSFVALPGMIELPPPTIFTISSATNTPWANVSFQTIKFPLYEKANLSLYGKMTLSSLPSVTIIGQVLLGQHVPMIVSTHLKVKLFGLVFYEDLPLQATIDVQSVLGSVLWSILKSFDGMLRKSFIALHVFLVLAIALTIAALIVVYSVIPNKIQARFASLMENPFAAKIEAGQSTFEKLNDSRADFRVNTTLQPIAFIGGTAELVGITEFIVSDTNEKSWAKVTMSSVQFPINIATFVSVYFNFTVFDTPSNDVIASIFPNRQFILNVNTQWTIRFWGTIWYSKLPLHGQYKLGIPHTLQDQFDAVIRNPLNRTGNSSSNTTIEVLSQQSANLRINSTIPALTMLPGIIQVGGPTTFVISDVYGKSFALVNFTKVEIPMDQITRLSVLGNLSLTGFPTPSLVLDGVKSSSFVMVVTSNWKIRAWDRVWFESLYLESQFDLNSQTGSQIWGLVKCKLYTC